ncbi:MAG: hypothetical protein HC908_08950 [Calothrix sp. SM1_7_51]|nr:hypothetical protein [Calothrix sp. SM1_7_51]
MQQVFQGKQDLFTKICEKVEYLMQRNHTYQSFLDKETVIERSFKYYSEEVSQEELKSISDLKLEGFIDGDMMTLLIVKEDGVSR